MRLLPPAAAVVLLVASPLPRAWALLDGDVDGAPALDDLTVVTTSSPRSDGAPGAWAGIFLGTNDRVEPDVLTGLAFHLSALGADGVEIVSIIGGMYYLRLLERTRFHRLTLFDANILELGKAWRASALLRASANFSKYKEAYEAYARRAASRPDAWLLPPALQGARLEAQAEPLSKAESGLAYFGPDRYPEFQWQPDSAGAYESTRANVRALSGRMFTPDVPTIDAEGRVVLVYLSAESDLEAGSFRRATGGRGRSFARATQSALAHRIRNASLILPLYSPWQLSKSNAKYSNSWLLDPHLWWGWAVHKEAAGGGPMLQVWAAKDRSWEAVGSWADEVYGFAKGVYADEYVRHVVPESSRWEGTVVLHALFDGLSPAELDGAERAALVRSAIGVAIGSGASRVLVTELLLPDRTGDFWNSTVRLREELRRFVEDAIPAAAGQAGQQHCALGGMRHAPGAGLPALTTVVRVDCVPARRR